MGRISNPQTQEKLDFHPPRSKSVKTGYKENYSLFFVLINGSKHRNEQFADLVGSQKLAIPVYIPVIRELSLEEMSKVEELRKFESFRLGESVAFSQPSLFSVGDKYQFHSAKGKLHFALNPKTKDIADAFSGAIYLFGKKRVELPIALELMGKTSIHSKSPKRKLSYHHKVSIEGIVGGAQIVDTTQDPDNWRVTQTIDFKQYKSPYFS